MQLGFYLWRLMVQGLWGRVKPRKVGRVPWERGYHSVLGS